MPRISLRRLRGGCTRDRAGGEQRMRRGWRDAEIDKVRIRVCGYLAMHFDVLFDQKVQF